MKIAIFSDTFPPKTDGVASVVRQSAKGLADMGHKVIVFTVSKNGDKSAAERDGFEVVFLPSLPAVVYPDARFTLPVGASLSRLKKFGPDIIHSHTPFSMGWEAVWGAKILKVPLVGTHHTFYDYYLKHAKIDYGWGKSLSWKYTVGYYNRCRLVLSPTRSLAEALKGQGIKKPVEILRNSVETDMFRPAADKSLKNGKTLVYMGRLSYEKSIDKILEAFAIMIKKDGALRLAIVGDGPELQNLRELADNLGVKDKVFFTGTLHGKDLIEALRASDVFLTACKNENMPISVLEAMASGLPVVAVPEKGLKEIIEENVNGFFAETDNAKDIAQKTLDLISKPALVEKFGAASRRLAMEYSREKVSKFLENYYKKILNKKRT